jgi:hypothetical protein
MEFFDLSSSRKSLAFFLFILDVREAETRTRGARVRGLGGRLGFLRAERRPERWKGSVS